MNAKATEQRKPTTTTKTDPSSSPLHKKQRVDPINEIIDTPDSVMTKESNTDENDNDDDEQDEDEDEDEDDDDDYYYSDSDDDGANNTDSSDMNMEQKRRYHLILQKHPSHKTWVKQILEWEINPPKHPIHSCTVMVDLQNDDPLNVNFSVFDDSGNSRGSFSWRVNLGDDPNKLFPVVPPTMDFHAPRLPFNDLVALKFWPDFQPERWNFCADLNSIFTDILTLLLTTSVLNSSLILTEQEELLLLLTSTTRVFPGRETNSELPTFGVTKMVLQNKSNNSSKKGFSKGTGYSSGHRGTQAPTDMSKWNVKEKAAKSILFKLWEQRDHIADQVLLGSSLLDYAIVTLSASSLNEFETRADFFLLLFEWSLRLFQRGTAVIADMADMNTSMNTSTNTSTSTKTTSSTSSTNSTSSNSTSSSNKIASDMNEKLNVLCQYVSKSNDDLQSLAQLSGSSGKLETRLLEINQHFLQHVNQKKNQTTSSSLSPSSFSNATSLSNTSTSFSSTSSSSTGETKSETSNELYLNRMQDLQVTMCETFQSHIWMKEKAGTRDKKWMRRVALEFRDMSSSLPLSENGGIFLRWSEENTALMKVMIIPGCDTPYGCGTFMFDVYIPPEYPNVPPQVKIVTTGGGSHRFNPNLYAEGKVCLSLLGTWQGEPWVPKVSTLYQVFVSIYGLIFVDEPYFNEPGYQNSRGTPLGTIANEEYNAHQRYKTVELAMVDPLKKPTPEFATVIQQHFWMRKIPILNMVKEWSTRNSGVVKSKYKNMTSQVTAFEQQLNKLVDVKT